MVPLIPAARKLVALSLCILLTAGAWVPLVTTDNEDSTARNDPAWEVMTTGTRSNGNGTKDNPFMIYTIEDLQAMKVNLTAHYALANDIDASVTEEWNSGAGFEPVGPDWDIHFTGSLDGRNFTISGLYINRPSTDLVGLFGYVDSGGSVSNVGVVNVDIKGRYDVGGLVGYIGSGSVSNCSATGSVSGDSGVGGLLGMNYDSVVTACSATGSVSGNGSIGGLVGYTKGWVSACSATGSVTGTNQYVGGLVGQNYEGSVTNCYATGSVTGNNYVGGLVGDNGGLGASVENCYSTGNVTRSSGSQTVFGGFVGRNYRGKVINCYSTGSVHYTGAAEPTDKGFCGEVNTGGDYEMTGNFWDTETSGQTITEGNATGKTTEGMKTLSTFTSADWDIVSVSDRDSPDTDYLWNILAGETYPFLSWEEVSRDHYDDDDGEGGIQATHVVFFLIVMCIVVTVILLSRKNSQQPRQTHNGTTAPTIENPRPAPVPVPEPSPPPPPPVPPTSPPQDTDPSPGPEQPLQE